MGPASAAGWPSPSELWDRTGDRRAYQSRIGNWGVSVVLLTGRQPRHDAADLRSALFSHDELTEAEISVGRSHRRVV